MTQSNSGAPAKYRPYFIASQIQEILRCLKTSSTDYDLIRYLETFSAKIEFGTVSFHKPTPRHLSGSQDSIQDSQPTPSLPTDVPYSVTRERLYKRWLDSPENLTSYQLEQVSIYRYENDMMTPDEEIGYVEALARAETKDMYVGK